MQNDECYVRVTMLLTIPLKAHYTILASEVQHEMRPREVRNVIGDSAEESIQQTAMQLFPASANLMPLETEFVRPRLHHKFHIGEAVSCNEI